MDAWKELSWRGLISQHTPDAEQALAIPTGVFCGFDPTAPSLHVGNLIGLLVLRRLALAGHRTIAIVGDTTALIGDPSGKQAERNMASSGEVGHNAASIERQIREIAQPDQVLFNSSLVEGMDFVDFLRNVGKYFPVNELLRKKSVELRRKGGMSFAELGYALVQAMDFAALGKMGVSVQVGGSDQFGNITAGIELARRRDGLNLHGITWPLLTGRNGRKFGKSEDGAIWLDASLTSPFDFFQFWRNQSDSDVGRLLRWFTFLSEDEIATTTGGPPGAPQLLLATQVTSIVHGVSAALGAKRQAAGLFGDGQAEIGAEFCASCGATILDLLMATKMWPSRGEAKRDMALGGATLNGKAISGLDMPVPTDGDVVVGRGKRRKVAVRIARIPLDC